jgi:hypothetical protein
LLLYPTIGLLALGDWRMSAEETVTVNIVLCACNGEGLTNNAMAKTLTHRVMATSSKYKHGRQMTVL